MSYVRNCWYVAGWVQDLEPQKPLPIEILGEPIVLYRGDSGRLVALEDRCVHRLAPLSIGRCEAGDKLRCMYHGMVFSAEGRVVEIPGQDKIPPQAKVRAYPVLEKHSWIWVWMGNPAQADAALIPPAVGLDSPDYLMFHGQLDFEAEAKLINENLLDLSHAVFVHAKSFAVDPSFAAVPPQITPIERGFRFSRWWTIKRSFGRPVSEEACEQYTTWDYLLPGILLFTTGTFARGTAEALRQGAPDWMQATANVNCTSQAVTPLGKGRSRYFFSQGPHRRYGDEVRRDEMEKLVKLAFLEDKMVIEAQQRTIDKTPNARFMPAAADRGVTLFNLLVERMARADTSTDSGEPEVRSKEATPVV